MSDNELDPNIIGNQIPKERPHGKFYLRKGYGSWSSGTQVELLNWPGSPSVWEMPEDMCEVRILAGNNPIIEVAEGDIIERRPRGG